MASTHETTSVHLTKRSVDALKPLAAGDYFVWDDEIPGFGCRVYPSGKRVYVLKYRLGGRAGRQRRRKLGAHGVVTPEEARRNARALLGTVAKKEDPHAESDRARVATRVSEVIDGYLRHVDAKKKPTTASEYRRLFKKHIVPAIGTMPLVDVTPAVVGRLHHKLRRTPIQANRVLARLSGFFSYCHDRHLIDRSVANPCASVEHYREEASERFLSPAEIARLGQALTKAAAVGLPQPPRRSRKPATGPTAKHRAKKTAGKPLPANPLAVGAIRLALLTGMRRGEVLGLRWSEVDKEHGILQLADSKTGRKAVPVGAPALALLDSLPRIKDCPFVFPSASGKRPLESVRRVWDAVRVAAKLEEVRFHDLRHSFAAAMAEQGESLLLIGSILGHRDVRTTDRYAHLADDRRRSAADTTSARLAEAMGLAAAAAAQPAKVIPLNARQA
ncbi:MAG TPA: tyrosine-type recombinase/integrase [Gemmatimonadaceae bacterium]